VTQFWKTILLGTIVNFLFYSLNEATGSYLSCVKISVWYLEVFQRYNQFTVQHSTNLTFRAMYWVFWVIKCDKWLCWQTISFLSSIIHRKRILNVKSSILGTLLQYNNKSYYPKTYVNKSPICKLNFVPHKFDSGKFTTWSDKITHIS